MKLKPLTLLAVIALALTACSNQDAEVAPDPVETTTETTPAEDAEGTIEYDADTFTSYPTNADYYFFGDGRVVGKFSIPTEPSEDVNEVFNELVPEDDATFIKVTVDNREGESQYSVDTIAGYDSDGKEYEFQDFGGSMSDPLWSMWEDIDLDDDAAIDTHDRLEDMVYSFDTNIEPGAVKDVWLISQETDLPDEFTRLGVNGGSSYMGGSDPLPVEMAEFDLDFEAPTEWDQTILETEQNLWANWELAAAIVHLTTAVTSPAPLHLGVDKESALQSEVLAWIAHLLDVSWPESAPHDERPPSGKRLQGTRLPATGFDFIYPTYRQGYAAPITTTDQTSSCLDTSWVSFRLWRVWSLPQWWRVINGR